MALLARFQDALQSLIKEWLKQQLDHLVSYESRVGKLEEDVETLEKVREGVQSKVDEEETRFGREIEVDVQKWLKGVDKIIAEKKKFIEDGDHAYAVCSNGFLPKPGIRYRLSKTAHDIWGKVNGLLETRPNYDAFSSWKGPLFMNDALSNDDYESIPSRNGTIQKIKAALEDTSVRMIGVYGWTGVGKTTLVKEVAKNALKDSLFDMVIMLSVTRSPDIRKIQGQIADTLGMILEEESEIGRAGRIRERLKNKKENTLIILDDLCAKLDFNMLGFPSDNVDGSLVNLKEGKSLGVDNVNKSEKLPADSTKREGEKHPSDSTKREGEDVLVSSNKVKREDPLSRYKGCKIMMISETNQVLLQQMDGKEEQIFSVDRLKEKEAETLFNKMAEINDKDSEFEKLAAQIASKCSGLPMPIVTTAKALKNKSRSVWEDTYKKLERERFSGAPEFSIKLSYELLENEELKYTFLLCARIGRDILIMDFVKYCIGLGFLQGIYTVREARDKVVKLLLKLKESSLLSDSYSSDRFTMQDIVQGAALSLASQEKHVFMMTKRKLDEWPDKDELERYAVISLRHCDIEFPESMNCSRLRVFHVDSIDPNLKIPKNFFEGMTELRVLILTGFHLSPLPLSIRCLAKLRMLCLERCVLGEELSIIGELKNLRILSLAGSDFQKLPDELRQLVKLQILDISNCSKLRVIPPNIISRLTSLEDLYMRNNLIQWKVEGQEKQREHASLSELRHLNQLTTLDIKIPNVACLPKNLFFDKLDNYKIVIGDLNAYLERDFMMPEKYEMSRFLALQLKDDFGIHSQKGIKMLFERVENLLLGELKGVRDIFCELNVKGFQYLKHLSIINNTDVEYIIKSMDEHIPEKAFTKLESMCLFKLKNMKQIYNDGQLEDGSFCKLKTIKISICDKLKNVFFSSMVKFLIALETIEVSECNSLEGIVVAKNNAADEIKFPKLRFLKLHSLSKFIGFYTIGSSTRDSNSKELFDQKVVVSELERMVLSSIEIQKIWSDKPLQSSNFGKLTSLDVSYCGSLTYLLSFSMAKNLGNLQSLIISDCEIMENIFKQEEVNMQDSIFPKLKNIKLSCLKRLSNIWQPKDPPKSYDKLDTLIVEDCDKLDHVFACDMGKFRSLCNLRVTNCKAMEVIFDLKDDGKQDAGSGNVTNLQNVHLEALPKLKHIWKKEPDGTILNFQNLQKIWVRQCPKLGNIFPFSLAKGLEKLECLVAWDCDWLEQIVAQRKSSNRTSIKFEFPKLATIQFLELPKLTSFYLGEHELSCPALKDLTVELCDRLELFRTELADKVSFPKEVIYNLKSMQIEQRDAKWLTDCIRNYRMDKLEELHLSTLVDFEILYFYLHRSPNLKSLCLNNCFIEELVPHESESESLRENEKLGVVPKLKRLKLMDLPSLQKIGFERDMVLQRIEFLILNKCPHLITIMPSSVSFTHLTFLEVVDCDNLTNLMAPSTAKSLLQLTIMKVIQCKWMKEIVSHKGNEEENEGEIIFRQLKALELVSLPRLISFCSSNSFTFEFPSLEKLIVSVCPKMKSFSQLKSIPPILRQVYTAHRKEGQRYCYWEGDLNDTIRKLYEDKLYFEGADEVEVGNIFTYLGLQSWDRNVVGRGFSLDSLKTLKLRRCNFGSCAISATVLPNLKNLTNLEIQNCKRCEFIFGINDIETMGTTFLLKKLTLDGLPNLTHVWDENYNNSEGIHRFQNLQKVVVTKCRSLKTMFPAAVAKNLKKLAELEIRECKKLLEVVGKEEAGKEEAAAAEGTEELLFPILNSLNLSKLPQLNIQPLFSYLKVISNLEALTLNWKDKKMLCERQVLVDLPKLNQLKLWFDDVNEVSILPFELLQKAPNLEILHVSRCSGLKEIFPSQNPVRSTDEDGQFGHLNKLSLFELFELKSIGLEHLWVSILCEKLHILTVTSCPRLTTIIIQVQPEVSFSCLKQLTIEDCRGLKNLFTSSIAEKLMNLQEMHIRKCESLKEIVTEETTSEEIKFERLKTVVLDSLASLLCFYSGGATLQLPFLIKVVIRQCPKMRFFSQNFRLADSFSRIQVSLDSEVALVLRKDLNAKVERAFLRQEHLVLGDYPLLQKIWLRQEQVPGSCFSNLKSLIVEGCEFLSNAILPSHLLSSLCNLEELQVRKCNSVETIFDHTRMISKEPASDPLSIRLKKLILEQLPTLKHVWKEDTQGSPRLSFLEDVSVDRCESIRSLLPASMAKRVEKLDVKNCEGLVEIAKDIQAIEGAIKASTIFPTLISLRLWNLPNLKYLYPGMHILETEWPKLRELDIFHCHLLFASEFQNSSDSHPEGLARSPTGQQAFVSVEKVTRHLEQLSLNKEDTLKFEQGKLQLDLQKLKFLKFQHFDHESDAFPYVFLLKVPLPKFEKLGVIDSAFKEIFPSKNPDVDDTKILSLLGRLRGLELNLLSKLKSIGLEHSWMNPIAKNLQTLVVLACNSLTNLAPSTVSFSHLTELIVENCDGLEYLFTSSTAKNLGLLYKMCINNCVSIENIMAKGGDKPDEDEIKFGKLKILSLSKLPILASFYTGSSILNFPSLEEVSFTRCHNMKVFCHRYEPKNLEGKIDGVRWHGDLNTAIERQFGEGNSLS